MRKGDRKGPHMKLEDLRKEKRSYTRKLEELLKLDPRSGVASVEYGVSEPYGSEFIEVRFRTGRAERIDVTCDSLAAILRDVTKRVYHYAY